MIQVAVIDDTGSVALRDVDGWNGIKEVLDGAYIEPLSMGDNWAMYVDEDGIAKGLKRNDLATDIAVKALAKVGRMLIPGDFIKGKAVLVGKKHSKKGWWVETDLPKAVINEYLGEKET